MILRLIAFPGAVTKAHEELDRAVGDRMPTVEGSPNLPYIKAMIKEVLRWRKAMNNGITHVSTVLDGQTVLQCFSLTKPTRGCDIQGLLHP
jgi:cytochrome P450